jgi:hypothetical protein
LPEQAEKASSVLAASAQELPARGKEGLSYVAENAPNLSRTLLKLLSKHIIEKMAV